MNARLLTLVIIAATIGCGGLFAKPPCALTDADYAALANAKKNPLDRAAVDALRGPAATNLCKARALVAKLRSLGCKDGIAPSEAEAMQIAAKIKPDEVPIGASKYITAGEWAFEDVIVSAVLARQLETKGLVHPN